MPFVAAETVVHQEYDAIVVGSGAGGGQMAYTLTMNGARVLMLEAGRRYDPAEAAMFQTPEMALRQPGQACATAPEASQSQRAILAPFQPSRPSSDAR